MNGMTKAFGDGCMENEHSAFTQCFTVETDHSSSFDDGLIRCNRQSLMATLISGHIHEINNPNNNILLASRLLSDYWKGLVPLLTEYQLISPGTYCAGIPLPALMESFPRILGMIAEDVGRISAVAAQLKPEDSKAAAHEMSCDMNDVTRTVAKTLSGMIAKRTRHFRLNLADDLLRVAADFQQMQQVMENLLCNALQALPDREREVIVGSFIDGDTGNAVITIRDDGIGMSPPLLEQVYEPFFTTKEAEGCPGLGLFVSRRILTRHKGTIMISSSEGEGSLVTVRLPLLN